ncbi:MAG: twin-arginine translocase subunit TatB [Hyphomicrobiaceae bacterium]|nr:twin-arginine translocase subunit TatB [Hyphomicrobiaceae bacterium]
MFDIGATELLVIAVITILVVGPRELPGMLRGFGKFIGQARRMATDVQRQFNQALKEADLADVAQSINDVRQLDPRRQLRNAILSEPKATAKPQANPKPSAPDAPPAPAAPAKLAPIGDNPDPGMVEPAPQPAAPAQPSGEGNKSGGGEA